MHKKDFIKKLMIYKRNKKALNEENNKVININPFKETINETNSNTINQKLRKISTVKLLHQKKINIGANNQIINNDDNLFLRDKNNLINKNSKNIDIKRNTVNNENFNSNKKYIENNRLEIFKKKALTIFNRNNSRELFMTYFKKSKPKNFDRYCKNKNFTESKANLLSNKMKNIYKSKLLKAKTTNNSIIIKKLFSKFSSKDKNKIKTNDKKNFKINFNNKLNKIEIKICRSEMNLLPNTLIKKNKLKFLNEKKNNNNNNNNLQPLFSPKNKKSPITENKVVNNEQNNNSTNTKPTNISSFLTNEMNNEPTINKLYESPIKRTNFSEHKDFINFLNNNNLYLLDNSSKNKDYESKFLNYELGQTNSLSQIADSLICSLNNDYNNSKNNEKIIEYEKSAEEIYKDAYNILDSNNKLERVYLNNKIKDYNYELNFGENIDELKEGENINRIINLYINYNNK